MVDGLQRDSLSGAIRYVSQAPATSGHSTDGRLDGVEPSKSALYVCE